MKKLAFSALASLCVTGVLFGGYITYVWIARRVQDMPFNFDPTALLLFFIVVWVALFIAFVFSKMGRR